MEMQCIGQYRSGSSQLQVQYFFQGSKVKQVQFIFAVQQAHTIDEPGQAKIMIPMQMRDENMVDTAPGGYGIWTTVPAYLPRSLPGIDGHPASPVVKLGAGRKPVALNYFPV